MWSWSLLIRLLYHALLLMRTRSKSNKLRQSGRSLGTCTNSKTSASAKSRHLLVILCLPRAILDIYAALLVRLVRLGTGFCVLPRKHFASQPIE